MPHDARPLVRRAVSVALLLAFGMLAACDMQATNLALVNMQPKAPAQRNHTNFYPALQCMDDLFVKAKRAPILISSNQIPDKTRTTSVGTREMIITALNHMTRRSKAFSFVEQGLVGRTSGDTLALEKDARKGAKPPAPRLYINGSISQVDTNTRSTGMTADASGFSPGTTGFSTLGFDAGMEQGVVTLDLHLVSFPSRVVIPGSAISNSITVKHKAFGSGLTGLISQRTLGLTLQLDVVESRGQAVRSLVELGLVEMLGRYTGVPFWECLSLPTVNAAQAATEERAHMAQDASPERLRMAQTVLHDLGYVEVQNTGLLDAPTRNALSRFQAQKGLLASGTLDFDTYKALEQARAAMLPTPQRQPQRAAAPTLAQPTQPTRSDDDGYQSLQVFVDDVF